MRHRFHALCPYFAMFPETFPELWLERLTSPGDVVLDPFAGRGTTPFQALLMDRRALAVDINPVAYCITRAKTDAPTLAALRRRITVLENQFAARDFSETESAEFFEHAFHPETLAQLCFLRQHLNWRRSGIDAMVAALILGILHGESERSARYLSNQMPRTVSTKPAYSVRFWKERGHTAPKRNVFERLRNESSFRYESGVPASRGTTLLADMRELPRMCRQTAMPIKCAITSPPYLDTTSFEEDQWLRLWFLGGPPAPTRGIVSPDDRIADPSRYWNMIADMWRSLGQVLSEKASVVIRLGGRGLESSEIADRIEACAKVSGRGITLHSAETSALRRRQTNAFRPGSVGHAFEVDCHFTMQ